MPNIEPFKGNFLYAASTLDEIVKIKRITNAKEQINFNEAIFRTFFLVSDEVLRIE